MYFTKVQINNFKSIGEEKNNFAISDRVTTVIGKNESGKTNIIDALSFMNFSAKPDFNKYKNKRTSNPVKIEAELAFSEHDNVDTSLLSSVKTQAVFENKKLCVLSGALVEAINNDKELNDSKDYFRSKLETLELRGQDLSIKNDLLQWLNLPIDICNIEILNEKINLLQRWAIPKIADNEIAEGMLSKIIDKANFYLQMLPAVFKFIPNAYDSQYSLDTISKLKTNHNPIIKFLNVAQIDPDELIMAMQSSTDAGRRKQIRDKIQKNVAENIAADFCKFYSAEKVEILLSAENGYFDLMVNTDTYPMAFSERSTGLRWYLDLFIQMKERDLLNKNVLILLDEPGMQLHIDAQNELLSLFNDITERCQIIYTTHSPFLIATDNLSNVRLVENVEGTTFIHNKYYAADISSASKEETISPLIRALGFSPKFNIGPQFDRLNIVVEGISDYNYIMGMLIVCDIDETLRPHIIPSVGVSNIHNVVSILIGWNCHFKVVTDYDKEAYNEIMQLKKLGLNTNVEIFTINTEIEDKEAMSSKPFLIEDMFTSEDMQKFAKGDKALSSNAFYQLCRENRLDLAKDTIERFKKLFQSLGII